MSAPELRPYQRDVIDKFHDAVAAGRRRIILVAPTGSGKTIIGADIINTTTRAQKRVLVLAHRREIIQQTAAKLSMNRVYPGIIMAGVQPRPLELAQLASIQTLWVRSQHTGRMDLPPADLLVIDECHHAPAKTYRKIIAAYPDAVLLGLTATPCRGDGRGLGGIFETMIECPQVPDLISLGFLVPTRTYAPVDPDLSGVRTRHGDYVETELADRMDRAKLVGDIVTHWHKYGERRRTVAFAVSVGHSIHIRDEFIRSGVRCEHIDGSTPKPERDATLARLATGEIEVVSNCMVLTEGWDMPEVGCCILARPTKKMGLYRQMIGRVLRPAPTARPMRSCSITPERCSDTASSRTRSSGRSTPIASPRTGRTQRARESTARASWNAPPAARSALPASRAAIAGSCRSGRRGACPSRTVTLRWSTDHAAPTGNVYSPEERERWHGMLICIGQERGYKPGWAAVTSTRKNSDAWPSWGALPEPIPPTPEVRSWVRSRLIAYAKRRSA